MVSLNQCLGGTQSGCEVSLLPILKECAARFISQWPEIVSSQETASKIGKDAGFCGAERIIHTYSERLRTSSGTMAAACEDMRKRLKEKTPGGGAAGQSSRDVVAASAQLEPISPAKWKELFLPKITDRNCKNPEVQDCAHELGKSCQSFVSQALTACAAEAPALKAEKIGFGDEAQAIAQGVQKCAEGLLFKGAQGISSPPKREACMNLWRAK